ncbi:conserved hypothetical protein [Verticillium alfalfae VaMs.102]|uniref:Major facilitator superfamily (MFS) profile domain-containing protein n=1 Tax=Verticillium alfalfae (strain VaMs.102 / ATCC MYA-4576 / FGSC 10136) TaxID=526221 RepID=C9SMB5_VERA1|nr:conserved hypothetical protein [Verticillium alfalfae VaMs.102]EEY19930.1 conserved hypothetical protein [Verticillium alfalfae VaMs.102]
MGLGVLESKTLDHVPGTTRYYDDPSQPQPANGANRGLKVDDSGPVPIILIPQPSDDPNDPLNWPLWKRDLITFVLSVTAIFATALGPILAANTVTLALIFGTTFTRIAILTGYFLLGVGAAAVFFVPSGRIWGKRHLFIFGAVVLVASSAWGGSVGTNYESFIGARVVQGIACSPYETLVNVAVGDLYPVHQRGLRMAFTNLAVFGGAFFTPILVGQDHPQHRLGMDILSDRNLLRHVARGHDKTHLEKLSPGLDADPSITSDGGADGKLPDSATVSPARATSQDASYRGADTPKKTYIESLALFDGRKTDDSYLDLLLRPFALFAHPAFIWGCLIQGTMIGWTVFIGVIVAAVFLGPPFFWNEVSAGYAYLGPFIGALAGFAIAGALSDWSAKYMTRLNKGVYEPEFRIVLVLPMFIIGGIGLYGFALTAGEILGGKYHYSVPLIFFGFEVAGMVIGAVASSLYIVDAYRDLAIEGFTSMIIFKNFFSFALTWTAYDWIIQGGVRKTMLSIASVQVVICAMSIPMCKPTLFPGVLSRGFGTNSEQISMASE